MKWTSILAVALFTSTAINAQQITAEQLPQHPSERDSKTIPGKASYATAKSGTAFYTESFDSGIGGWTVFTSSGVAWAWTDVGPGMTTSTYPVPVLNTSTPSGWMMLDDDFLGQNLITNSELISPVIDLSTAPPNLKVEFDQYMQEFQMDTCFVGVSTDGGLTWNEVKVNDGVGRDGRPNPEIVDVDISAWVAVNPSNVQLRFRYKSDWDYGWQIDNITIKELPQNDMAILNAYQTAYDFTATNLQFVPYSIYPESQLQEMVLNARIKNKGFLDQDSVVLNVEVIDPTSTSVFTGASTPTTYTTGTSDLPIIPGFTPAGTLGSYTVNYDVVQSQTDDVLTNNSASNSFDVSTDIYALDRGASDGSSNQGVDEAGSQYEWGNFFEFVNPGDFITHIQVAVDSASATGTLIYGIIYNAALDAEETITDDYEITAADLTNSGGANWISLPLDPPFQPNVGEFYCVMAGHYGGPDDVRYSTSGQSPEQVSIIRYPNTPPPDDNFFTTRTPMVRAVVADNVGINEHVFAEGALDVFPNPFTANTTIRFEMLSSEDVVFELVDIAGRVILNDDLGTRSAGMNQYMIDGADLAPGTYAWKLTSGESIRSGLLIRAER